MVTLSQHPSSVFAFYSHSTRNGSPPFHLHEPLPCLGCVTALGACALSLRYSADTLREKVETVQIFLSVYNLPDINLFFNSSQCIQRINHLAKCQDPASNDAIALHTSQQRLL
jgi:hypothetical protein